jgi:HlyD family secretion protein
MTNGKRWIKRVMGTLVAIAVVAMVIYAALPKPIPVDVAVATREPMTVTVDEDGRTRVKDRYVVSAPLSGNLARIELEAGDEVKEGAVLARIVPLAPPLLDERSVKTSKARVAMATAAFRQASAQLDRSRAAEAFAKSEAERAQELFDAGAIPRQQLEQKELTLRTATADLTSAQFAHRVAAFEVEMAKAALAGSQDGEAGQQIEVEAPVNGKVLRVMRQSAGAVQAGTALLELGEPHALEVVVDVLTRDAVSVRPGATVYIEQWGGERLEGTVRYIEPSAFTRMSSLGVEEQRVNVVIDLTVPENRWSALGDGYRVETRIVTWQQDDVLQVPASAVFRHGDGWAVFAVEDGTVSLIPIAIGQRNGRQVQVDSGLEAGARVIIHPGAQVVDGVKVEIRQAPEDGAAHSPGPSASGAASAHAER